MELKDREICSILEFVDNMDFIKECWERKLCISAVAQSVLWGKKIDSERKKYGVVDILKRNYNR